MDKITNIGIDEFVKYILVFIAILNSLIAYIFTTFKAGMEKRVGVLEDRSSKDHDKLNQVCTEHRMNHRGEKDGV
jgi:hypothetical protein